MPIFAVHYDYDDRDRVRDEIRPEHRAYLSSLAEAGSVLARGPYLDNDKGPGGLLVVRASSEAAVTELLDPDPFNREGLIAERRIREWNPIGEHPWD